METVLGAGGIVGAVGVASQARGPEKADVRARGDAQRARLRVLVRQVADPGPGAAFPQRVGKDIGGHQAPGRRRRARRTAGTSTSPPPGMSSAQLWKTSASGYRRNRAVALAEMISRASVAGGTEIVVGRAAAVRHPKCLGQERKCSRGEQTGHAVPAHLDAHARVRAPRPPPFREGGGSVLPVPPPLPASHRLIWKKTRVQAAAARPGDPFFGLPQEHLVADDETAPGKAGDDARRRGTSIADPAG